MGLTRKSVLLGFGLIVLGALLWRAHATAWDLGRRSPVLSFDAAQYALAARELAEHGRLATDFALPIELARHTTPPWPLAVVQPGLVLAEAAVFRLIPPGAVIPGLGTWTDPARREWLTLVFPFAAFLALGVLLAFAASRLLARHAPNVSTLAREAAALTVGAAFLLDPEAQHFAVGAFTELPFTLGLAAAVIALASGRASRHPLAFGLLLGVTGTFRGTMIAFAPLLALAAALEPSAPPRGARVRVLALVLLGYVLPLAPWWFYKWRVFGTPAWDLSLLGLWDGVGGRSWFSLSHLPVEPVLLHGLAALAALAPKFAAGAWRLALTLLARPRALWTIALVAWLAVARPPRALAVAALAVLALTIVALATAALGAAWIRYLFPARIVLEAAGLLAAWGLGAAMPDATFPPRARQMLATCVALIALAGGVNQMAIGLVEARAAASERGVPAVDTMRELAANVAAAVPEGEVVMSNLGPGLAWSARRPVLHLARTPGDVAACRARVPFRTVVLAFRDPAHAWPGWGEVIARPDLAPLRAGWNVRAVRTWNSADGFRIVWLELGDPTSGAAAR